MPKRSREEAINTDINNENDDNILEPSSKKRKLTSLSNEDEPKEDGAQLQMDGWNFDKTTFESGENNNDENSKNNDKDDKNKQCNDTLNTSGFSAFTGMGFERSISNNTSSDKNEKNGKQSSSKHQYQYVSDDENENKNKIENGNEETETTDFEKSWNEFSSENINENNNGEISWKWDDNTNGTSNFNWSWDDDKDKKNDKENIIDPTLENTDTNSSWNFDFNSNSKSNVEWGTQVDEDTIEPIAELNGENKEKGDENDRTLYSIKVKVYAYKKGEIKPNGNDENNEENMKVKWRECGQGMLKINQLIDTENDENNKEKINNKISARILCRRDNIHTVILNEPIVKEPDDWYKLLKDTRVQFCVVKSENKENSINDPDPENSKPKENIVPYFVKPINGGSEAAKALLHWIKVAQNCVKTQTPYKERSLDSNSKVNTDNIDDDDI